jgi:hypothetical protein
MLIQGKNLVFHGTYEIFRWRRAIRMTGQGIFVEVSNSQERAILNPFAALHIEERLG